MNRNFTGILALIMVCLVFGFLTGCGSTQSSVNQPPSSGSNPTPTIATISPTNTVAGGAAFTLTITGTNFVAASIVNFGGSAVATTFVSSTQLTAAIPAASIASTGTPAVTVTNPAPGGGTSKPINFTITSGVTSGSIPTIQGLFPSCAPAGEQLFQLLVEASNVAANSVVRWNGSDRPTSTIFDFGLAAQISASDVAAAGTAEVTVFNSGAGGGSSNSLPFSITTGTLGPQSIAVGPAGKFAYVTSAGCNDESNGFVSMYTINPTTGALSKGSIASTLDDGTDSVTVDPSGKFAYVVNFGDEYDSDGSIVTYAINPTTGALTSTPGGITGAGVSGTPEFFNSMAFDPSGKFAYAAEGGAFPPGGGLSSVAMFTVNSTTGALTSIGMITAGSGPDSVAVDPTGKFAYVPNFSSNDVSMYTIDGTTGALASIGTISAGAGPDSVAVDPAGKFAYVANWTGYETNGSVSMYTIDATTGALASIGSIAAGTSPYFVAVDPAGKFAYVANWTGPNSDGSVSMYTIDATTGVLTPTGTIATELSPTSIAIHPSGKFAYVTNSGSNSVSMYSIDSATGTLTLIGTIGT